MINAIVYTSNTGYTAKYAQLLASKTGLPAYSTDEAMCKLSKNDSVIYLGWLMAGKIKDYKKAFKTFDIKAACSVGMNPSGTQTEEVRKNNGIPETIPLFTLQGGYDYDRLHGMNKFLMKFVSKMLIKKISAKPDRTDSDNEILDLLINGGSLVREENLEPIMKWLKK